MTAWCKLHPSWPLRARKENTELVVILYCLSLKSSIPPRVNDNIYSSKEKRIKVQRERWSCYDNFMV